MYLLIDGKTSPRTSGTVDNFSYSDSARIFGSEEKQNTALKGARGRENCALVIISHTRLNKTKSVVFIYHRFSLFLKESFSQISYYA